MSVELCYSLIEADRASEAVKTIEAIIDSHAGDLAVMTAYGVALKAAGRMDEAIAVCESNIRLAPRSGVAEHNLASTLGEAERFDASARATRRAFDKGLDAPETWLVRARAFRGLDLFDDAEEALRRAIFARPTYVDAHADLAQLIWMRTEDVGLACETLDRAIAQHSDAKALLRVKARTILHAGDRDRACEVLQGGLKTLDRDPLVEVDIATILSWSEPVAALEIAERAYMIAPDHMEVMTALCICNLAAGRADAALWLTERLRERRPLDQFPIALMAVAWRLLGDERYARLYDYDRLVRVQVIDTPKGWSTLDQFLADLATTLAGMHGLKAHPVGQSLRFGTQTQQSLSRSENPVILAFFSSIDSALTRYFEDFGEKGILPDRTSKRYNIRQSWSVLLRSGGFHVSHLHPMGWVSSAFHVSLPTEVNRGGEGWLKFGEPGVATTPRLEAEYFLRPSVGSLVLFPSYMWHGTVPFSGSSSRLSVAFDAVPA